jgi:hypothetical protein
MNKRRSHLFAFAILLLLLLLLPTTLKSLALGL